MNRNFPRFPNNTFITHKKVFLIFIILICECKNILSQDIVESTTVKETFLNNNRGWTLSNNFTTISIDGNRYIINFNSSATWNSRINIPNDIKNCLLNDDAKVSFDLQLLDRNGAMTSGIGLVFDQIREDYNVIYLGEEAGRIFSSIIPRRDNAFRKPIKDGRSVKFQSNTTYRITIDRKFNNYRVFINNSLILSFAHKEDIQFNSLYFTTGKYAISNLVATKSTFVTEGNDIGEEKNFDPSKHNTFILLAGVSNYPSTDYPPLNSPILDITSMRNFWLSTTGGSVPWQNISFFPEQEATVRNVVNSARKIANKATPNDVIIIYLTGHGYWGGYYCCYDALLPYEVLNDIIKGSRAKHKLVIVDACFSGCVKNIITPPTKGTLSDESLTTMFRFSVSMAGPNTSYLMSCSSIEASYDGTNGSNSAFTKGLLKALNDRTDRHSGYIVRLSDVYSYLTKYFQKWNQLHASEEHLQRFTVNGERIEKLMPVIMNPQLVSENKNYSLPLAIIN